jgi:hypothetical protein
MNFRKLINLNYFIFIIIKLIIINFYYSQLIIHFQFKIFSFPTLFYFKIHLFKLSFIFSNNEFLGLKFQFLLSSFIIFYISLKV